MQTCDEAMTDERVVEFVTDIYRIAEADNIPNFLSKVTRDGMEIELRVGLSIGSCSARIVKSGVVIAEYNIAKGYFSRPQIIN